MGDIARSYAMHQARLNQIFDIDQPRFERMVKVHVLAKELCVSTNHLEFMIEQIAGNMKGNNSADYFLNDPQAKEELTRAMVVDFRVRMRDMCTQLLINDKAKGEVQGLIGELLK